MNFFIVSTCVPNKMLLLESVNVLALRALLAGLIANRDIFPQRER
jgi:hypothetical protein